jgi:hypothetical protein
VELNPVKTIVSGYAEIMKFAISFVNAMKQPDKKQLQLKAY